MNKRTILALFIILAFSFTSTITAASTVDTFESYTDVTLDDYYWAWFGAVVGDGTTISIDETGGSDSDQAMQMIYNFSNLQENPWGYAGGRLNANNTASDWSAYGGITIWLKATETGDNPQYIQFAVHEGNGGSGNWGEKLHSAKVYINNLDAVGEYVYLAFADFVVYDSLSTDGPLLNGQFDTQDVRNKFVFSKYNGTASSAGGSSTILVDDITVVRSISFIRAPYLQNVTQTSVKVMWGDNNSSSEPVFWGSSPENYTHSALSSVITANDGSQIHTATISGLTAGEKVYYTVGSSNWGDATYYAVTAPVSGTPFRFTVYSDTQGNPKWTPETQHDVVVGAMVPHNPDIVLHCGDHAKSGAIDEFNNYYFTHAAPLIKNTPMFNVIGNHDLPFETVSDYTIAIKNFRDLYDQPTNSSDGTEDFYSFDYSNVHFVNLNSEFVKGTYQDNTKAVEMKSWLINDLAGTTQQWKVVFFHRPTYTDFMEEQEWSKIFEDNGVQLVFYGHIHNYLSHLYNGVTYINTAGGGGALAEDAYWAWSSNQIGGFVDYHFTQIDVTPTNLSVEVYDDDGYVRHWINIDDIGNVNYPPHRELVDDINSYVDNTAIRGAWPWVGTSHGGNAQISLDIGGITGGSNIMKLEYSFPIDSSDGNSYAGKGGVFNVSGYNAVKLWAKATSTGYSDQYLQIRVIEGNGSEKWKSSEIPLNSLDSNGEYVYLYFDDFVCYDTVEVDGGLLDGVMNKAALVSFFVASGFNGTATSSGTSTIWVDNMNFILIDTVGGTHLDDDFDSYIDNSALTNQWGLIYTNSTGVTLARSLNTDKGENGTQAMQMKITINKDELPATDSNLGDNWEPCIFGITGYETLPPNRKNLSNYQGLKVWLKPGPVSGDQGVYFKLNLIEDESSEEEKWMSPKVYLSVLDTSGEFVYFNFDDFYEYHTASGAPMESSKIIKSFLFLAYDDTTTQLTDATVYVDDITYFAEMPPTPSETTHFDDDFEGYASTTDLKDIWNTTYVSSSGVTFDYTLNTTEGVGSTQQSMQMDFSFNDGVQPVSGLGENWEPCIWGITGMKVDPIDIGDMTDYTGIRFWIKPKPGSIIGNESYFKLCFRESASVGSEKWMSPKVVLSDLDPDGEYVYFDFKDFYEYYTGSGQEMDRSDMYLLFLFLAYDNTATQTSSATVYIDDIRYVKRAYKIVNQNPPKGSTLLPEQFALHQNYPNPFNPVTTIQYDIPKAGDVNLVIYDIRGREVIRLVNDRLEAGYYHTKWDGKDYFGQKVASGVYIYLLQSGDYIKSKKLLLIK